MLPIGTADESLTVSVGMDRTTYVLAGWLECKLESASKFRFSGVLLRLFSEEVKEGFQSVIHQQGLSDKE